MAVGNGKIKAETSERQQGADLTPAEWHLMECLWEQAPRTGREVVDYLKADMGWSKSTTLTMLRRMTEKGLISCDVSGEVRCYRPLVKRQEALLRETEDFLSRVYKGSVGMLMSTLTKKQNLSKEEIRELYDILEEAERGV
ncbi:MAG: BlaI/MecI/CopY family transcriptional regulator [Lachnospiraceae bacterium]|nr:BlaI/MecI/CopY family transcriptional regulator [Lachnospiraceae bacterium]